MDYAELVCSSNFHFQFGGSHPEDLVARAKLLGYKALAITDEASVSGSVRAHLAGQAVGLPIVHGAQFHLEQGPQLAFLVRNKKGWQQLCHFITLGRGRADKGHYQLTREDLEQQALEDCWAIWLPNAQDPSQSEGQLHSTAQWLKSCLKDRLRIGVCLSLRADDRAWLHQLQALGSLLRIDAVAVGQARMAHRRDKPITDLVSAIGHGLPLQDCGRRLLANAEAYLRPRLRLARLYPSVMLANAVALAAQCSFSLDELRYEYPDEIVPAGLTPTQWLRHLTEDGAQQRFPKHSHPEGMPAKVRQQIEHELQLIHEMHYEPYFLTVYDIVAFARSKGIACQGRGSAANSAVCYCLGITEVDPSRMSMLFERFISKERNEPPDIDVDFEHQRREEVIQYIYQKYGRHRAALAAAIVRYRPRSALRDTGKALGVHPTLIDEAAKGYSWWDGKVISAEGLQTNIEEGLARLAQLPLAEPLPELPDNKSLEQWARLSTALVGFPRHLSQHVGGFVIARHRLSDLVPVENASMADRTVLQWDKDDIDALGLLKVDVLALGMLSAIRRALEFVGEKKGLQDPHGQPRSMAMQEVPAEDHETYRMIQAADTMGVFQIESRAQMSMLPRLKPACFYDLVIETAIVRPGPIQGGMVHPYLRRRQGLEPIDYPSPAVKQALERTLGVPIFQEQVMQLAILAAGFTAGEADQLRRAMAAWRRRGSLGPFHDKVINGMLMRGYTREFAQRVFAQIEGFGEYGFPESHAASFALLVYVSCWLKRHHPDAFLAALLNAQPMGFYAPAQLVRDAQDHGVVVHGVHVNHSHWFTKLEPPDSHGAYGGNGGDGENGAERVSLWPVRLGIHMVAGLPEAAALRLVHAREEDGCFESIQALADRASLSKQELEALAAANALSGLSAHRHDANWQAAGHERSHAFLAHAKSTEPALAPDLLPAPSQAQDMVSDYASLGLSLGTHPLSLLRPMLTQRFQSLSMATLRNYPHGRLARASGLVTHRQRPSTAKGILFMTLEDETGRINVVVWPDVLDRYRHPTLHGQLITVYGRWQRDENIPRDAPGQVLNLLAMRIEDHTPLLAEALGLLATESRDFR